MNSEYTKEDVIHMREEMIKARDKRIGNPLDFDAEEAVLFSHIIALLQQVIAAQDE